MKYTPVVTYDHLIAGDCLDLVYIPSYEWSYWLERNNFFRYECPEGTCYVVKNQHGYWIAEHNLGHGQVQKVNLGTSVQLAERNPMELCGFVRKMKRLYFFNQAYSQQQSEYVSNFY